MGFSLGFAVISFVFLGKSYKARTGKSLFTSDLLLGSILLFFKNGNNGGGVEGWGEKAHNCN